VAVSGMRHNPSKDGRMDSAESAIAELVLRRLTREHPEKWHEAVRGEAGVAAWFEGEILDAYLQRPDGAAITSAVVDRALMDERRKDTA
jgi:hypothetical protein